LSRAAAATVGRLGNPANRSSEITAKAVSPRSVRFVLRRKSKRFFDSTLVPRVEWDTAHGAHGEEYREQVTRMRPRHDRNLACGERSRASSGGVGLVFNDSTGVAGYSSVQSCGSVWVCPVCAAKVQARRSKELGDVLSWARREGHTVAMVTMTVRHDRKMPLATPEVDTFDPESGERVTGVWDAVQAGWEAVTKGSQWVSENEDSYAERIDAWDAAFEAWSAGRGKSPRGGRAHELVMTYAGSVEPEVLVSYSPRPQRRVGDQERYGVKGWARATEVTVGDNGWHVHVHAVLVLEGEKTAAAINAFAVGKRMWNRWVQGIGTEGFTAVEDSGGLDIRIAHAAEKRLAEYLTKDGLGLPVGDTAEHVTASFEKAARDIAKEAALGATKKGRKGGRTPFQLLSDLVDAQDSGAFDLAPDHFLRKRAARDLALWSEFIDGSHGRRQLTWSKGLRDLAGLEPELTDEEIADEDAAGELMFWLPRESWRVVRDQSEVLLEVMEDGGIDAVAAYLTALDVAYQFIGGGGVLVDDDPNDVWQEPLF